MAFFPCCPCTTSTSRAKSRSAHLSLIRGISSPCIRRSDTSCTNPPKEGSPRPEAPARPEGPALQLFPRSELLSGSLSTRALQPSGPRAPLPGPRRRSSAPSVNWRVRGAGLRPRPRLSEPGTPGQRPQASASDNRPKSSPSKPAHSISQLFDPVASFARNVDQCWPLSPTGAHPRQGWW